MNKKDLDRGYTDTGAIPEIGANIMRVDEESAEDLKWRRKYGLMPESSFGDGGFMDRDCNGYER
jgi:hypothetical protein